MGLFRRELVRFFFKKFSILLFTLFVIATVTFFLMKNIPGDPFIEEKAVPKEVLEAMHRHYGLDKPIFEQYLVYLKKLLHFDLGTSFIYKERSVNEIIQKTFPVSLQLGLQSLSVSLFFGSLIGSIAAVWKRKWQDHTNTLFTTLGISIPNFILAPLLQYVFCIYLHWLPIARWEGFSHTILPTIALSIMPTAYISRLLRSNLLEVLGNDYIRTAKGKGLSLSRIISKHALRNAFLPIISYLGPITAYLLTGSFVVEKIFGIPGLGQWLILSIINRDYPVIMGITIFYSCVLLLAIFVVDILYSALDPRIYLIKDASYEQKTRAI